MMILREREGESDWIYEDKTTTRTVEEYEEGTNVSLYLIKTFRFLHL